MISMAKIQNPDYLIEHSKHEYYTEHDNEKGTFMGALSRFQKLEGKEVSDKQFKRMMSYGEGYNGVELDPAPPKDWTVLYNRVSPEERKKFDEIKDKAIKELAKAIEQNTYYRETHNGKTEYKLAKAVAIARFDHHTARGIKGDDGKTIIDPQEHSHLVVFPKVLGQDGKFHSHTLLDLKYEKGQQTLKYLDSVYQYHLAKGLQSLGYATTPDMKGNFRIEGITQEQRKFFSKRTNAINEKAGENASYNDKKKASLTQRKAKTNNDLSELRENWQKDMDKLGLTSGKTQELQQNQVNHDRTLTEIAQQTDNPVFSNKELKTLAYREAMFSNKTFEQKHSEFKAEKSLKKMSRSANMLVHNDKLKTVHRQIVSEGRKPQHNPTPKTSIGKSASAGKAQSTPAPSSPAPGFKPQKSQPQAHISPSGGGASLSQGTSKEELLSDIKRLEQDLMSLKPDDPKRHSILQQIGSLKERMSQLDKQKEPTGSMKSNSHDDNHSIGSGSSNSSVKTTINNPKFEAIDTEKLKKKVASITKQTKDNELSIAKDKPKHKSKSKDEDLDI